MISKALKLVHEATGLRFPPVMEPYVRMAISSGAADAGARDPSEYVDALAGGKMNLQGLVERLAVRESYFFRDSGQFELVREVMLTAGARAGGNGLVNVLSAGCATGEEPYSLAMLAAAVGLGERVHVVGLDISASALAMARQAIYRPWSFRSPAGENFAGYFRTRPDGRQEVITAIRDRVHFVQRNLWREAIPPPAGGGGYELILCRNVLIYFDIADARVPGKALAGALAPGGWLIMGAADPDLGDLPGCERVLTRWGQSYRRAGGPPVALAGHVITPLPPPGLEGSAADARSIPEGPRIAPSDAPAVAPLLPRSSAGHHLPGPISGARAEINRLAAPEGNPSAASPDAKSIEEALRRSPMDAGLHLQRALTLWESGREEEAAASARRVCYLDPTMVIAHYVSARILMGLSQHDRARRALRQVMRLCANLPPDAILLGTDGACCGDMMRAAQAAMQRLGGAP